MNDPAPIHAAVAPGDGFVRNCWYMVGWSSAFDADKLHPILLIGEPIVVYRGGDGRLIALEDRCRHRLAPLSKGYREGDAIRCMYHGMKFAPDGRCIEIPGQDMIPDVARVRSYPVVERGGWIWLWPGDPTRADAALIPPVIGLDVPAFCSANGNLDYDARFKLINDNLLDFSHLSFLHRGSFGDNMLFALTRPRVERIDRGVHIGRWIPADPNSAPAPTQTAQGVRDLVDQYQGYAYLVPGVMILRSQVWPAGTAARCPDGPPAGDPISVTISCQAVTPLSARRTRYYFTAGAQHGPDSEAVRDRILQITLDAFAEDREIIEAQQAVIDLDPSRQIMPTSVDRAAILFDRMMKQID